MTPPGAAVMTALLKRLRKPPNCSENKTKNAAAKNKLAAHDIRSVRKISFVTLHPHKTTPSLSLGRFHLNGNIQNLADSSITCGKENSLRKKFKINLAVKNDTA